MTAENVSAPVVLIVDDDMMTRVLVVEALEPEGFVVDQAVSGPEAIASFQRRRPDVVLLDLTMPGMDGFECCRRLRALPDGARVPVVVLTGNDDDASIALAFEAGATDFTAKPMQWRLLVQRVRYLLRTSNAFDALARSEANLSQANAALTEMNEKFAQAHVQLLQSEKMASIGQLAAGVAHEINNPVGYIISNYGTLESYLKKLFSMLTVYEEEELANISPAARTRLQAARVALELEFLREDIPAIMTESRDGLTRIREIVSNLKDFAHLDINPTWRFENIHAGIDSTLKVINNEIKFKAKVIKEYGALRDIECILPQLNQVFLNIIVNAAHALPEQGGQIVIRTFEEGGSAVIEISDNGTGIADSDRARIFDPFFTTKPVGQGTGLGLSIAYGIINSHRGRIDVASELGKGTSFRITLPVKQANEEAAD